MTFAISEVKTVPVAKTLAALVPVLFCADLGAAYTYRRAVNWSVLWRLLPSIVGGLVVGFCCLAKVDITHVHTIKRLSAQI